MKIDIPWHQDPKKNDYNTIFFKYFFLSLKGKAAIADRIINDPRSGYYHTAKACNIRFHRPSKNDPDELVRMHCLQRQHVVLCSLILFQIKLCITLLIKVASECHKGIDNLWTDGNGVGTREYPAYGQYIPKHYTKALYWFSTSYTGLW